MTSIFIWNHLSSQIYYRIIEHCFSTSSCHYQLSKQLDLFLENQWNMRYILPLHNGTAVASHRAKVQQPALCDISTHLTDKMSSHHSGQWSRWRSWLPRWCWGEMQEVLFPDRDSAGTKKEQGSVFIRISTQPQETPEARWVNPLSECSVPKHYVRKYNQHICF